MPDETHYLRDELYSLVRTDPAIFDFLQAGSLDGLWYWDLKHPEHEWMSPRFWEVLGYDPAIMPHDPASWQNIINADDLSIAVENFKLHCASAEHPYDQIVRYRHKNGRTVTIRCRGIAIRDEAGQAIRMLGAHTDISDLVDAREAGDQKERAEAANLFKTLFLGNISHEIRTPLNSLLLIAQSLQKTDLDPQQAEMLDDLLMAGDQLGSLLSDLIDISKIEAGEISMERQAFSPRDMLEDVAGMFSSAAQEKKLILSTQVAHGTVSHVYGAVKRIRQVLINLVSNAIKFTPEGQVTMAWETEPSDTDDGVLLRFRVMDTGVGVPDAVKDMIFDRFQRSDTDSDLGMPGAGIGLSISKMICDLHDGALKVEDGPGGGAVFTAEFATRSVAEDQAARPARKAPEALRPGMRIVVAEDVLLNRRALKHLLGGANVDLVMAVNGVDALAAMQADPFDLALIDLRMPGMSGLEVVKQYRAFETENGIARRRVIACSAHVLNNDMRRYREIGFDGFLAKPFKLRSLINLAHGDSDNA